MCRQHLWHVLWLPCASGPDDGYLANATPFGVNNSTCMSMHEPRKRGTDCARVAVACWGRRRSRRANLRAATLHRPCLQRVVVTSAAGRHLQRLVEQPNRLELQRDLPERGRGCRLLVPAGC